MSTSFRIFGISNIETDNSGSFEVVGIDYSDSVREENDISDCWRFYVHINESGEQQWIDIFWNPDDDLWNENFCDTDGTIPQSLIFNIMMHILKKYPTPYEALDNLPVLNLDMDYLVDLEDIKRRKTKNIH